MFRHIARSWRFSFVAMVICVSACSEASNEKADELTSPPVASYTLSLPAPQLTVQAGASVSTTTVLLARTNFRDKVSLTVENLPRGVVADISNPDSTTVAFLSISVDATAPLGTYPGVVVRGVAHNLADRTTSFTLTIAPPPIPGMKSRFR